LNKIGAFREVYTYEIPPMYIYNCAETICEVMKEIGKNSNSLNTSKEIDVNFSEYMEDDEIEPFSMTIRE
jgi:hypothetical protein